MSLEINRIAERELTRRSLDELQEFRAKRAAPVVAELSMNGAGVEMQATIVPEQPIAEAV